MTDMMKIFGVVLFFSLIYSGGACAEARNFSKEFHSCVAKASDLDSRSNCISSEVVAQKKRLNLAYGRLVKKISPEDKDFLDKVQHDWVTWRDGNYSFLSEHVAGEFSTTRITSLSFLLNSVYDRADELEMILDEIGS
jgi:uncharacterized protein YecT (DUF1311 family)